MQAFKIKVIFITLYESYIISKNIMFTNQTKFSKILPFETSLSPVTI